MISRKRAPKAHMSNELHFSFLKNVFEDSIAPFPLCSMNLSTSGAKYSGVVAGTDFTSEKTKADPKSMILRSVSFPS